MGVPGDVVRQRFPVAHVLVADLDVFEVERGEHHVDPPTGDRGLDLIGVAVQRNGRGLDDGADYQDQIPWPSFIAVSNPVDGAHPRWSSSRGTFKN
jgi:hypothetical protein